MEETKETHEMWDARNREIHEIEEMNETDDMDSIRLDFYAAARASCARMKIYPHHSAKLCAHAASPLP
jgi:hypothetical protein